MEAGFILSSFLSEGKVRPTPERSIDPSSHVVPLGQRRPAVFSSRGARRRNSFQVRIQWGVHFMPGVVGVKLGPVNICSLVIMAD